MRPARGWGKRGLAILAALGACTADVAPRSDQEPTSTQTAAEADLAALLFDQVPPGYVVVAEETGPLTISDFDFDPSERQQLARHGFVRGYSRVWNSDDDSSNVIRAFVYEFADSDGAEADMQAGLDQARADGDSLFDVPGVAGGEGIRKRVEPGSEDDEYLAAFFVRSVRFYLVALGGPATHDPEEVIDLAKAMHGRAA